MAIWSEKQYNRINWKNRPSTTTPLGQTNLNKVDVFCNSVDNALIQFDAQKLNISVANSMLASVAYNDDTGVWTFKTLAGTTYTFNQNIEKIPVSFTLTEDGILVMTTEDGTEWECNIADLIKDYVFDDSETIAFEKEFVGTDDDGKGSYHVTASVKNGSITADKLNPDYRADILTYKTQAQEAANDSLTYSKDSQRWAVGSAEYEGSATDNAKYYKEQAEAAKAAAEEARDEAQAATGAVIATTTQLGVVKPDGTTIGVEEDGTIKSIIKAASLLITDNQGLAVEKQGEVAQETTTQALIDAIADKVANQLVTNTALTSQLANYVTKAMMSNVQVNDQNKVPTSALAYAMQQQITENEEAITGLNSELINGSGLGLTEGMYSIYAPNTADDMIYPGLYRLNGITVGSMTDFYGYAIVMSDLDHAVIKQLIYHNASSQSLLRYRVNNQWTDAGEFALKDDLAERVRRYIDIENQEKFIGFVVNEYDPSILINPVSEYIRLQYKDIDTTYKIYDYGLWGNWENGKDIVSDLNIIKKKISFYAYGSETLNSPFKAGLTGEANSGIVISHFISDYYGCQLAISEEAYPSIFIRGYAEKWIEWKKVYPL